MGKAIHNNPSPVRAPSSTPASTPPPAANAPVPQEQVTDQAAADLDMLVAAHRHNQRRRRPAGPRQVSTNFRIPTPESVARRAIADSDANRFFEAMVPMEQAGFMEEIAEKIAEGAIDDMEGMVEIFNNMRARANDRRRASGDAELPELGLDHSRVRAMLEHGIELGLEKGIHAILETVLKAALGTPSRSACAEEPADAFEPLPDLERDPGDHGLQIQWSHSF